MMVWLLNNSLWIVGLGLMLASSGIDGAYMVLWMPPGAGWLGYVLNTTSDVAGMVIMYWYGRLLQTKRNESGGRRKLELSQALLIAEIIAILYSWLFSWRQLLIVMSQIEGQAVQWLAPVAAGFIPLLLAATGYAQSMRAGRIVNASGTQPSQITAQGASRVASDNGHEPHACAYCGATKSKLGRPFASKQAISAHLRGCAIYQAQAKRTETRDRSGPQEAEPCATLSVETHGENDA